MKPQHRVNIDDETFMMLRETCNRRHITDTECIRLAMSVYKFLETERQADKELLVISHDGTTTRVDLP